MLKIPTCTCRANTDEINNRTLSELIRMPEDGRAHVLVKGMTVCGKVSLEEKFFLQITQDIFITIA